MCFILISHIIIFVCMCVKCTSTCTTTCINYVHVHVCMLQVTKVNVTEKSVTLSDGSSLSYGTLLLATGAV